MNRALATVAAAVLAAAAPAHAATRYYAITGATAPAENACPAWIPESTLDDCSFNASNPTGAGTAQWIGPVFGAGYYAPGQAPAIFTTPAPSAPVAAPAAVLPTGGKTGIPVERGFIAIDDRDTAEPTDDVVTGTVEFGAFERNVATGPATRVVESAARIIHRISAPPANASNVDGATANGNGGFDYVLGVSGGSPAFPDAPAGSTTADGGFSDSFPSEVASQSSTDPADVPYWSGPGANGIARFEGATAVAGLRTAATVWDYGCTAQSGPCPFTSDVNWDADSRARFDNVILRFSTDGSGNITQAAAYLVNESDLSSTATGTDSWQATTLSFTGAETTTPTAFDERFVFINGLDLSAAIQVLANDVPGVAPQVVTIATPPAHGTASVLTSPANVVEYVPANATFEGVDTFTYTVTDANSQTATGTVEMILTDPISCTADFVNGTRNTASVIDVLANDAGFDIPPVTVAIVTAPASGSAVVNPDLTVTYTPATDATGFFNFTYRVNDGTQEPATCTVTVAIEGEYALDDTATAEDFVTTNVAVLANDRRDLLAAPIVIEITEGPAHGSALVNPAAGSELALVRYTSDAGYTGPDTFRYRLTDASGYVTNEATVTITVSDSVPVAVDDTATVEDGVAETLPVATNDTGKADTPLTLTIVSGPAHGTATVTGQDSAAPSVTYTSVAGYAGTDSLTYTLTDADDDVSNVATVTITVTDSVPVANADTFNGDDRATDPIFVLDNDDGLVDFPLTLEITQQPTLGTATVLSASATGTGLPDIGYASNAGSSGSDSLQYIIRDADGDTSAPATITITIANGTPVAVDDVRNIEDGASVTISVLSNDLGRGNRPLTVTITDRPDNGTATLNTASAFGLATVTYRPAAGFTGTDTFRYTFSDADGQVSNEGIVTINVADSAPVAVNDAVSIDDRQAFNIDVLANDTGLSDGPLVLEITGQPGNGTVALISLSSGRPGLSYASNVDFAGTDTVRYRVTDADGDVSNEATLTLTVANTFPVALNDRGGDQGLLPFGQVYVTERIETAMDVVRNDTGRSNRPLTITITQAPAHGTVTIDSAEVTELGRPGIRYRSNDGYVGPDSLRYRITDADGDASNEATVTFDVVSILTATNDGSPLPLRTNRNRPLVVDVLDNDGGLAYGPVSLEIVAAANGTATVNGDNTVTFVPARDFVGRFPSPICQPPDCFSSAGGGFRYRLTDAANQTAEGVAFVDVFPAPVEDQGGSALDEGLLAVLAGGILLRRLRRR